jgi:hypothetical protein
VGLQNVKKILIFGATGNLGSIICNNLSNNYEIVGASPDYEEGRKKWGNKIRFYDHYQVLNENNADFFLKEKFDVIINCAGHNFFDKWTEKNKTIIYNSRIDVSKTILEIVQKMPGDKRPEVIIFASSVAIYANTPERVDEYAKIRKDINYFKSLLWHDLEAEILAYTIPGTRIIIPRYGIIISPVSYVKLQLLLAKYYLLGYLGKENPIVSWISHKDVAGIIELFITNNELQGIFNVTSPRTIMSDEMADGFATVMNRRILYRIPSSFLKLMFGDRAKIFLYPLNVFPRRLKDANYQWVDEDYLNALYEIKGELLH